MLIKHLPDWESVRASTTFAISREQLNPSIKPEIAALVDFSGGTEAVTANYPEGTLLLIEYTSPQASIAADKAFTDLLNNAADPSTMYRRIGNYNAFVFDSPDTEAAGVLLDQIKYEKDVQWLGDNPFIITAERAFILTTSDVFLSTLYVILIGIALAIGSGLIAGIVYFTLRDGRRARVGAFSDAGGMTRLNLDGFTAELASDRLVK